MSEATVILLDNSDYALDGDYLPSRWGAQVDAANVVYTAKTNSNAENVVGVMTSAGATPRVLATPTSDAIKLAASMHGVPLSGTVDLLAGIQIAQLALKHRQNKAQSQRIVVFVASPLPPSCTKESLTKLGKKMKKNNVAIDVVSLGEVADNAEALQALLDSVVSQVDGHDNSHLVTLEPTLERALSDVVLSSPMLARSGDGSGAGPSGQGSGADNELGVDPNLDPELAMALRMSLEDERTRQAAAQAASQPPPAAPADTATASQVGIQPSDAPATLDPPTEVAPPTPIDPVALAAAEGAAPAAASDDMELDEDAELQRALALSQGEDASMDGGEDDEDEEVRRAIALSLQEGDDKK